VTSVLLVAVPYYVDYALFYPNRAARSFDTGGVDAITRARALAPGHRILISHNLGSEDALMALLPHPSADPLASVDVRVASAADIQAAEPGDLLVLTPLDTPPDGATLLFREVTTGPVSFTSGVVPIVVFSIYRR
jgi:hypothetical protein